jgi:hypothetical protein
MNLFRKLTVVLLAAVAFVVLGSAWVRADIVYASPSNDLALAGTATQSSWPSWAPGQGPGAAIDGNRYGGVDDAPSYSFIHTDFNVNPWWEVTLAAPADIGSIIVFNRTDVDDIGIRLNPFTVEVFNGATLAWSSGTITTFTPDIILGGGQARGQTFAVPSVTGNIVKVTHIAPSGDFLNIAEVEVYSVPEPGALVVLTTGLIGLLCYAWRTRR